MPSSTKKTKKKLKKSPQKVLFMIVALSFLVIVCIFAIWKYTSHEKEQAEKIEQLEEARVLLDKLKKNYDNQNPVYGMDRWQTCRKTSVKSGNGWIVCGQYLGMEQKLESNEDFDILFTHISNAISLTQPLKFIPFETFKSSFRDGYIINSIDLTTAAVLPDCEINLVGANKDANDLSRRGNLKIEISCVESHLDEFIYPEARPTI